MVTHIVVLVMVLTMIIVCEGYVTAMMVTAVAMHMLPMTRMVDPLVSDDGRWRHADDIGDNMMAHQLLLV